MLEGNVRTGEIARIVCLTFFLLLLLALLVTTLSSYGTIPIVAPIRIELFSLMSIYSSSFLTSPDVRLNSISTKFLLGGSLVVIGTVSSHEARDKEPVRMVVPRYAPDEPICV